MLRKIGVIFLSGAMYLVIIVSAMAMEYKEAPILKVKVAAGEIPPVEERLPQEPLVVKPLEEIGQYGGTLHQSNFASWSLFWIVNVMVNERLVRWTPGWKEMIPNIAKSWKMSEDGKSVTFFLRKGIKWSDGVPFTADDFEFWWNEIMLNDDLTPAKPAALKIGGEMGRFEKLDDYTIKYSFTHPCLSFIDEIASGTSAIKNMYAPQHYLKQFHPKYVPMEKIKEIMKEKGFTVWMDLFRAQTDHFNNPGCPQIDAWVPINTQDQPVQVFVRNPYYWKVDPEGKQLPYIDGIERKLISGIELGVLRVLAGEIDFDTYDTTGGIENYTVLMQNREKGNYRIMPTRSPDTLLNDIMFNFWHKDPVLRKLFRDKQFRIALSIAINRDEINQLVYKGTVTPSNFGAPRGTAWYDEEICKLYTEYNPKRANELLDEIGLTKRDAQGYRLRSDGKRLQLSIAVSTGLPGLPDSTELVTGYWKKIGIQTVTKPMTMALLSPFVTSCEHDLCTATGAGAAWNGPPLTGCGWTFPYVSFLWNVEWGTWYASEGKSGEEPPAPIKRMMEIREEMFSELSYVKRVELFKEAVKIHAENLYIIGVVKEPRLGRYFVVKNNLRNVLPELNVDQGDQPQEQFFFKK